VESLTCNRCKSTVTLAELFKEIKGGAEPTWRRILLGDEGWRNPDELLRSTTRHLCPLCLAELEQFMAGGSVPVAWQKISYRQCTVNVGTQ